MAAEEITDSHKLFEELTRLERGEVELSARRKQLHERMDAGRGTPHEFMIDLEQKLSEERLALQHRVDELHAQLSALIRRA